MIRKIYENIISNIDVRKNLIELKQELKKEGNKVAFQYILASDNTWFYQLLESDDAKVRKNVALIMGELKDGEYLQPLLENYKKENTLFVKSAYLKGISNLDYTSIVGELENILIELTSEKVDESNRKHNTEQIHILDQMLLAHKKPEAHKFAGYSVENHLILITNRDYRYITANQIKNSQTKEMNAGVYVISNNLHEVLPIRTYSEMLFLIPGLEPLEPDAHLIAEKLLDNNILFRYLEQRHEGEAPFYFRVDVKNKMDLGKKSIFAKKIATELETHSDRKLINSTSNYELEIRFVEGKTGNYHVLLKLHTLKDERFAYRKNTISASIHPINAALVMELAQEYLVEDGQILDPYCGVGTMLIERNKKVKANPMYGIDIFGKAIEAGRENSQLDNSIIHFINRDFMDFEHEYEFDEIITNTAAPRGRKTEEEIKSLYRGLFQKAPSVLKEQGIIILYTNEREYAHQELKKARAFHLIKEYEINKREGTYLLIIDKV